MKEHSQQPGFIGEHFKLLAETMFDCCGLFSAVRDEHGSITDFRIDYLNPTACQQGQGTDIFRVGGLLCAPLPEHVRSGLFEAYRRVVEHGESFQDRAFDYKIALEDGVVIRVLFDVCASKADDGVLACWRDATASVANEAEQRDQDSRLRTIVNHSVDGLLVIDGDGVVRFANPAACSLLARAMSDLIGYQLGTPAINSAVEMVVPTPKGALTVEIRACEVTWERRPATLASLRDVSERLRAQAALNESESRFRQLFENSIDAILIADEDGRYVHVNHAACDLFGRTRNELLGRRVVDFVVPADQAAAAQQAKRLLSKGNRFDTFAFTRPSGEVRHAEFSVFPLSSTRFASVLRDVTESRMMEERLRQSQKMEEIGKLAGGVAHDFNNLLTAIISFAGFVRDDLPPGDPRRSDIVEVLSAADRASSLTRQLLAFSRRQPITPQLVDLNSLVANVDRLLRRVLGEDVEVVTVSGEDLWPVFIDAGQFEQVVINMAVNARDAMPSGGQLVIETANDAASCGDEGCQVLLRVRDTGIGMDEQVRSHIFEPFFTTKETGKGTGLGLSMVYGLVSQAGGTISVESEVGRGSCFEIRLPRAQASSQVPAAETSAASSATGRGETILVVEDEAMVRRAAVRVLSKHGYTVLEANDGEEAVTVFTERAEAVDLVLCDVVMPRMNGQLMAAALRKKRTDLKVLFMTGYAENAIVHRGVLAEGLQVLSKPFTEQGLLTRVRQLLDG